MKACGKIRRLFSSHFHTVRLFLFLDLLPRLLFNNRPLTVLVSAEAIRKHTAKLGEQTAIRRHPAVSAAAIVSEKSAGISLRSFWISRSLSNRSYAIAILLC